MYVNTQIVFICHGKTKSNMENRIISNTDEPLCQVGIENLKNTEFIFLYSKEC